MTQPETLPLAHPNPEGDTMPHGFPAPIACHRCSSAPRVIAPIRENESPSPRVTCSNRDGCPVSGYVFQPSTWNLFPQLFPMNRSPDKPETQAVAQLEVRNGIASLKHLLAPIEQVSDGMMLYRSPVESAPALAPFEKLVEEWRAKCTAESTKYCAAVWGVCADRLSAVVEEVRGTK